MIGIRPGLIIVLWGHRRPRTRRTCVSLSNRGSQRSQCVGQERWRNQCFARVSRMCLALTKMQQEEQLQRNNQATHCVSRPLYSGRDHTRIDCWSSVALFSHERWWIGNLLDILFVGVVIAAILIINMNGRRPGWLFGVVSFGSCERTATSKTSWSEALCNTGTSWTSWWEADASSLPK